MLDTNLQAKTKNLDDNNVKSMVSEVFAKAVNPDQIESKHHNLTGSARDEDLHSRLGKKSQASSGSKQNIENFDDKNLKSMVSEIFAKAVNPDQNEPTHHNLTAPAKDEVASQSIVTRLRKSSVDKSKVNLQQSETTNESNMLSKRKLKKKHTKDDDASQDTGPTKQKKLH